ncbi:MAG TPA: hypothetical protein VF833_01275 [Gaiellaceae bacterium]
MQHRRYSFVPSALAAVLLASVVACSKQPGSVERKSESTTQTAAVTVGSRVRLTEQTGDDKARRVTVKIEG